MGYHKGLLCFVIAACVCIYAETPLEDAIEHETVYEIQKLINQGEPITVRACELASARGAVRDYFISIITTVLDDRHPEQFVAGGITRQNMPACLSALMLHAHSSHDVRKLLHRGADVQYRDEHGRDAQYYAHERNDQRTQAVLVHERPSIYQQLCMHIQNKTLDASFLRTYFTGLNRLAIDHVCGQPGSTALQQAVTANYYAGVRLLLDYGATGVQSALNNALAHGDRRLITLLMHRGGRLARVEDPLGTIMRENKQVHELISWLAPLVGGRVRKRALLYACLRGDIHSAQAIASAGASITHRDEYGTTPLFAALLSHNQDMVAWVLAHGGAVILSDEQRTFASHYFSAGLALVPRRTS